MWAKNQIFWIFLAEVLSNEVKSNNLYQKYCPISQKKPNFFDVSQFFANFGRKF